MRFRVFIAKSTCKQHSDSMATSGWLVVTGFLAARWRVCLHGDVSIISWRLLLVCCTDRHPLGRQPVPDSLSPPPTGLSHDHPPTQLACLPLSPSLLAGVHSRQKEKRLCAVMAVGFKHRNVMVTSCPPTASVRHFVSTLCLEPTDHQLHSYHRLRAP